MNVSRLMLSFLLVSFCSSGVFASDNGARAEKATPGMEPGVARQILGVVDGQSRDNMQKEARKKYLKLSKIWHPDKFDANKVAAVKDRGSQILTLVGDSWKEAESVTKNAEAVFKALSNAHAVLMDNMVGLGFDPVAYFKHHYNQAYPEGHRHRNIREREQAVGLDDRASGLSGPSTTDDESVVADLRGRVQTEWADIREEQDKAFGALQKYQEAQVKKGRIEADIQKREGDVGATEKERTQIVEAEAAMAAAEAEIAAAEVAVQKAEDERRPIEADIEARKNWQGSSAWKRLDHVWNYGGAPKPEESEVAEKDRPTTVDGRVGTLLNKKPHYTHPWAATRAWQRAQSVGANPSWFADAADLALFTSGSKNKIRAGAALSGLGRIADAAINRSFTHEGRSKAELYANKSVPGRKRSDQTKAIPAEFAPEGTKTDQITEVVADRGADKDAYRALSYGLETANRVAQPITALTDSGYSLLNAGDMAAYNRYLASKPKDKKEAKYARGLRVKKGTLATLMALEALLNSGKYWAYVQRGTDPSKSYVPDGVKHADDKDATWVARSNTLAGAGAATALVRRIMMNIVKANHIERAQEYANMAAYRRHAHRPQMNMPAAA